MTDYEFLKKNNLFEAHMKFVRALGEGYGYGPIEEADDPNNPQGGPDDGMGGPDPMGGGSDMGGMPSSGDPNGAMPPGGDPNAMGPDGGMGGTDPMGGMPPGGDPNGAMPPGGDPNAMGPDGGMGGPDPMGGGPDTIGDPDPMGGDDDDDVEIDVDDITNAQEKMNKKVNIVGKDLGKVDDKIEKLLNAINKLGVMFDKNNHDIEDLRREFEKRNPTQTEKLNLRSLDSYPYKVNPTDYWADKAKTSNYSAYSDNSEPTTQEYVITNSDVDDFSDKEMSDSFKIDDDLENMDIKRIFGI